MSIRSTRPQRIHRPCCLPSLASGVVLTAMSWLVGPVASADAATLYSRGRPVEVERSGDRVIIDLDGTRPWAQLRQELALAGFTSLQPVEGLPPRLSMYYVSANPGDVAALARLRGIPGIRAVRPAYRLPVHNADLVTTGQIVARFQPGTTLVTAGNIARNYGLEIVQPVTGLSQVYLLRPIQEATTDVIDAAARLYHDPQTIYAHPSILMHRLLKYHQSPIQDPLFDFQWHLRNIGQLPGATPGADVKAVEAWRYTLGQNVIVGVNDSSVHWRHEDLVDNYLTGYDYVNQDSDPSPEVPISIEGHGTSCAGLIAARANTLGLRGVAPLAQFTFAAYSAQFRVTDTDIAQSFLFHEANGAAIISNSWGLGDVVLPTIPTSDLLLPDVITDAIDRVSLEGRGGRGVLVMFASGNESLRIPFGNIYAAWPTVMAIGATLRNDHLTCYSNFGEEQSVVAPGGGFSYPRSLGGGLPGDLTCFEADIATTDIDENDPLLPTRDILGFNPPTRVVGDVEVPDPEVIDFPQTAYTHRFNGTSAACPIAAGVAALVFSISDTFTAEQVRNILEHTADKVQAPNERFDPVTGHNIRYGHGRVNALRAVEAARRGHSWPSPVRNVLTLASATQGVILWTNPENDFSGVLIARTGNRRPITWAPTDGIPYVVGEVVAPDTEIVYNGFEERLDQTLKPGESFEYALYVRNGIGFYSWGRRARLASTSAAGAAPRPSISASSNVIRRGETVQFWGGAISADPAGLTYLWDFGDGGETAEGTYVTRTYNRPGEYLVSLTVTDSIGQTGRTTTLITVRAPNNQPPQVSISASVTSGTAPLAVIFNAAASDPDGNIESYRWTFGDGTPPASGSQVEHVYLDPGTFLARVTVTDNLGATASAEITIQVSAVSATAARTDPPNVLPTAAPAFPFCGGGLIGGFAATLAGLVWMMSVRRRSPGC